MVIIQSPLAIYNFEMIVTKMIITHIYCECEVQDIFCLGDYDPHKAQSVSVQKGAFVVETWRSQTTKVTKVQF